jgi:hypothetical protein
MTAVLYDQIPERKDRQGSAERVRRSFTLCKMLVALGRFKIAAKTKSIQAGRVSCPTGHDRSVLLRRLGTNDGARFFSPAAGRFDSFGQGVPDGATF